jgi:hypothetical protein
MDRGALISPFIPLLRSPELMGHAQRMGEYLRYRSTLVLRLSELAILITARHWNAQYEWFAHHRLALKAGLNPAIAEELAQGKRPTGMDADEDESLDDGLWSIARDLDERLEETITELADRIGIIKDGKLLIEGSLEELRTQAGQQGQSLEDVFLRLTGRTLVD